MQRCLSANSLLLGLLPESAAPAGGQAHQQLVLQVDLTRYTLPTYMRIVTYKTAYYSFFLPVACGLLVAGVSDPAALATAKGICLQMGQYFQVSK